jgi:hypothetical protein
VLFAIQQNTHVCEVSNAPTNAATERELLREYGLRGEGVLARCLATSILQMVELEESFANLCAMAPVEHATLRTDHGGKPRLAVQDLQEDILLPAPDRKVLLEEEKAARAQHCGLPVLTFSSESKEGSGCSVM